jgi:[ribosomal protein S5]-alanine N-acetyltransferase
MFRLTMILETHRLTLQPFTLEDLDTLVELHANPEVNRHFSPTGAWSKEITKDKLERFIAHQQTHGYSKMKVLLKDGTFIGRAGFLIYPETGETELGYCFKREYWYKGYATEVSQALVPWIFDTTALNHIIAFAAVENLASRNVLEKIGMTFTDSRPINNTLHAFYKLAREEVARASS